MVNTVRIACCAAVLAIGSTTGLAQQGACSGAQSSLANTTVRSIGQAVVFRAGMAVDADGAPNAYGPHNRGLDYTANAISGGVFSSLVVDTRGRPLVQRSGRFKGFYVSTTSLHDAAGKPSVPGTYVNAARVPYIVLPPEVMEDFGVALGDLAAVRNANNGRLAFAIFADVGPRGRLGEGSMALARALGLNDSPRRGGTGATIISYVVFPNSGLGPGRLRSTVEVRRSAARAFRQWGGVRRLTACSAD